MECLGYEGRPSLMKRMTKLILSLAVAFIIVGGVGSFYLYQELQDIRKKNEIKKSFTFDGSDTLVLDFKQNTNVTITKSNDNKVHMERVGLPLDQKSVGKTDWEIKKDSNKTTATINNHTVKKKYNFNFSIFSPDVSNDMIQLRLPNGYKHIEVNGKRLNLNLYDFNSESLKIKANNGDVAIQDANTNNLDIESTTGNIELRDMKISEKITLNSSYGALSIFDTRAKEYHLNSTSGDILLGNTRGTINAKTRDGNLSLNHNTGKANLETQNSDIFFHTVLTHDDVTLKTTHGNITLELDDKGWKNATATLKTSTGVITDVMDETLNANNQKLFEQKKDKPALDVTTQNGNISVVQLEDGDTHYGYD
ncbi:hypothetical protein ESZ54_11425 [Vagococcus silagei]|uniref:DUF4097 domain-containing protein n=2 Tax=Vagococcus silagei TaxID=2508885 RepID=A0A4S3B6I8_9ENTE|nr:hypothetical protein ESZ54_11425 [Vagococcus silagei]